MPYVIITSLQLPQFTSFFFALSIFVSQAKWLIICKIDDTVVFILIFMQLWKVSAGKDFRDG